MNVNKHRAENQQPVLIQNHKKNKELPSKPNVMEIWKKGKIMYFET